MQDLKAWWCPSLVTNVALPVKDESLWWWQQTVQRHGVYLKAECCHGWSGDGVLCVCVFAQRTNKASGRVRYVEMKLKSEAIAFQLPQGAVWWRKQWQQQYVNKLKSCLFTVCVQNSLLFLHLSSAIVMNKPQEATDNIIHPKHFPQPSVSLESIILHKSLSHAFPINLVSNYLSFTHAKSKNESYAV